MNKLRKISVIGISLVTVISLSGISPAFATTASDIQAQINALLATIQSLQAQLSATTGTTAATTYTFTRDLTVGSKGDDVKALQQFLNSSGYAVATTGAGSPGNETTTFGQLTRAALAKYQAAKGITPSVGYFGPKTRAFVGSVAVTPGTTTPGVTTPITTVPAGTDLVVSLAFDTPPTLTLGTGTAFNKALKVNLTAGSKAVNITGITLQKTGFVGNTSLNGVDIVDASGVRHGNVVTSINADNTISLTFGTTPITVPAGTSTWLMVRFNIVSGTLSGGSTVGFAINSVSAITADTTNISGTFPITGNTMTLVTGSSALASTTVGVLITTGSSTINVDPSSEQEITRFRISETSSNEGVNLYSLTIYNYGNAGATSYKDVQITDQTGAVLATAQPNGQYVTFNLTTPYFIDKGLSKDFAIKAKIIAGTTQTIRLTVYNDYDIDLRGSATLVSVIPGVGGTYDSSFPIGKGANTQTIGSGTATLVRTADSPSNAITPGSQNVVLAKYSFKPSGENMELRQVAFYIATSTTAANHALSGTVYVKVNGAIVYSIGASSLSALAANTVTLSSYPIVTAGADSYITVETNIPSTATSVDNYQVKAFDVTNVKRIITGDLVDPGTSAVDGIALAVKSGSLTVTTLSNPAANSVVVGTNNYVLAQIQLNSTAGGEDIDVTKIVVTDTIATSTTDFSLVNNLQMYNGNPAAGGTLLSTTASTASFGVGTAVAGASTDTLTFNFSTPILVTRATPLTLYLVGNMAATSTVKGNATLTNKHTFKVASLDSSMTAYGATTGNSLAITTDITYVGSGQGQTVVAGGNLVASLVSGSGASPSTNQIATVGTTGATWFAFKLTSQYELQKITSLTLTASSSGTTQLATSTLTNIALYQDTNATPIMTRGQFDSCNAVSGAGGECIVRFPSAGATSDNILPAAVPTTGTTIYVKANIGAGGVADLGDSFRFSVTSTAAITIKGATSGSTSGSVAGTPGASGYTFVAPQSVSIEAVSPTTAASLGTSAGQIVGVFKVTNSGTAPIYLSSTTMTFANSGSATTTTQFRIYASAVGGGQSDISGWGNGTGNGAGYITATTTNGTSASISFATSSISAAELKIDGGSYRYLTIKTTAVSANNDTYQFSVSALGSILYSVNESDLGYSGQPSAHSTLTGSIYDLYVNGLPTLATVTTKT